MRHRNLVFLQLTARLASRVYHLNSAYLDSRCWVQPTGAKGEKGLRYGHKGGLCIGRVELFWKGGFLM